MDGLPDVAAALARAREAVAGSEAALGYLAALETAAGADAFAAAFGQRAEDGGALPDPFEPKSEPAGVASTAAGLEALAAVRRQDGPCGEAAVGYLMACQGDDGSWAAAAANADARLELTLSILGQVTKTPFGRQSSLERCAEWLGAQWSVERAQAGRYETLAGYVGVCSGFPAEYADEALQWCGRELERGFRTGAFGALELGRVFVLCEAFALPGAKLTAPEVVDALLAAQAEDGSFACPGASRVRATLLAATALRRICGS